MFTHKGNKTIYIYTALLPGGNSTAKLCDASFQCFLLRFITLGHLCKTLVRYLALDIILIESLNDSIELVDPCLSLLQHQLLLFISECLFGFVFGQPCDHFNKLVLVLTHIGGYIANAVQQKLLNNGIADLMRGTRPISPLEIDGANHVLALR